MIPERPPFDPGDRFRDASRAYFVYGVVYWIGGVYLALHGIGVRGSMATAGVTWIVLGLVFVLTIPYLLHRPRPWVGRWVLSRPDFARLLTALLAVRAWYRLRVAPRPQTGSVGAPRGGEITLGVRGRRLVVGAEGVTPPEGALGVRVMSMDLLLPSDDAPLVWEAPTQAESHTWRGAMEANALREFLADTAWGALDVLLLDLPPGTDRLVKIGRAHV